MTRLNVIRSAEERQLWFKSEANFIFSDGAKAATDQVRVPDRSPTRVVCH